ncbi:MAG: biotin--[acetyl-CoA-carboxylase] ligase [Gemmataceae bacterium]|nr:biotin--[acetyl-CoA-carboxylase] ligase [Gemmataceae bacterium]
MTWQPPSEEWTLPTRHVGQRVLVYDRLESTNDLAAALAGQPAHAGWAVLAREQTAGRGQHGRRWLCGPGMGVLLSVLLFPPPPLRRPAILTAWAAVAVCRTVHHLIRQPARIKWPNDVVVGGRKVCGILIEQRLGTVVGIGLNVNQSADDFAQAGLPLAASLATLTGQARDCDQVARLLLGRLDAAYGRLLEGDLSTLEAAWRRRLGLRGRRVVVETGEGTQLCRLREISWQGLELESAGRRYRLPPEAVRHIWPE